MYWWSGSTRDGAEGSGDVSDDDNLSEYCSPIHGRSPHHDGSRRAEEMLDFPISEKRMANPFVYHCFVQQNKIGYIILLLCTFLNYGLLLPAPAVLHDSARRPAPQLTRPLDDRLVY